MKAPISWLKEYTKIVLPTADLMWRLTEAGLTCESFEKINNEEVLDFEVTPNRPDWLSVVGIAREISAIQNSKFNSPKIKELPKPKKILPIQFKTNFDLIERWSAVLISGVKIKPSPSYIQERLKLIGLRPINAIVDITNYVMFELGIPMHAFDYNEIKGKVMSLELTKVQEKFTSVDEITYELPKGVMIIRDKDRIIDLIGIKGGLNSGITQKTKNILLHVTIDNPVLIRHTSQKMSLRSEASAIYERGPDKGGTVNSLKRAASLILEHAGGKIASELIDLKENEFKSWKLEISLEKLEKVLGIKISDKQVSDLLTRLNLSPKQKGITLVCTIPTYRSDLKIEEDLIEEVARLYGYNNFPKTLPQGVSPAQKIPYYFDVNFHNKLKQILVSSGYLETQTPALTSKENIEKSHLMPDMHIKIANPVSLEYEYLRSSLIPSLVGAIKINPQEKTLKLFELNKTYFGPINKEDEPYKLSGVAKNINFRSLKGVIDLVLSQLDIFNFDINPTEEEFGLWHPYKSGIVEKESILIVKFGYIHPNVLQNFEITDEILGFEFDVQTLKGLAGEKKFTPLPKYPPQIEDITLTLPEKTRVGEVIHSIKLVDKTVNLVELTDIYKDSYTFRIQYQHPEKTLTDEEVRTIRQNILKNVEKKYGVREK